MKLLLGFFSSLLNQKHDSSNEIKLSEFYAQFINPGDLCFDVGANKGERTDIFLALGSRVICIEPQPKCVDILIDKYQHNSDVVIVSKGLGAKFGVLPLSLCEPASTIATFSNKWKTGRFRDYKWESTVEVQIITLDDLIAEFGYPDFCKIDVEGFEYQVLRGLSVPVPNLSFEFTKEFVEDAKLCMDHLVSLGQFEFNYTFGEIPRFKLHQWVDANVLMESLSSVDDPLLWGDIYARLKKAFDE